MVSLNRTTATLLTLVAVAATPEAQLPQALDERLAAVYERRPRRCARSELPGDTST